MKYKKGTLQDLRHVAKELRSIANNVDGYLTGPLSAGAEGLVGRMFSLQAALVERAIHRVESNPTRRDELA